MGTMIIGDDELAGALTVLYKHWRVRVSPGGVVMGTEWLTDDEQRARAWVPDAALAWADAQRGEEA